MVPNMADDDIIEEETSEVEETEELTESTVKGWVREAIEDVLGRIPGEGTVETAKEEADETNLSIRQIEAAARKAVEEAMEPLKASIEKSTKPAKKAAPKPKPKPEPAVEESPSKTATTGAKLRKFMWGDDK